MNGAGGDASSAGRSGGNGSTDASSLAGASGGTRPGEAAPDGAALGPDGAALGPAASGLASAGGIASEGMPVGGGESSRAVAEGPVNENGAARGTLDAYPGGSRPASGRAPFAALPSVRPFFC